MDISLEEPLIAAQLKKDLNKWKEQVKAQAPSINPNYDAMRAWKR